MNAQELTKALGRRWHGPLRPAQEVGRKPPQRRPRPPRRPRPIKASSPVRLGGAARRLPRLAVAVGTVE